MGAFKFALKCICLVQNYVIAATALANAFIALGFIGPYFLIFFFPKIHQMCRILTFFNPQEEFIKKENAGSSLTSICVICCGVVEGQEKTWIIHFVFEMVGGSSSHLFLDMQHIAFTLAYDNLLPADWSYYFCLFYFWKAFSHLLHLIYWITCPSLFGFLFLTNHLKSLLGPHFCQVCLFFCYCYDWCTPQFLPPHLGAFVLPKNAKESVVAFLPAHFEVMIKST